MILDAESYDKLEEPEDDENDMLDLAFGLSDTYVPPSVWVCSIARRVIWELISYYHMVMGDRSRLGCQVKLTKDVDGMVATLPSATRNM